MELGKQGHQRFASTVKDSSIVPLQPPQYLETQITSDGHRRYFNSQGQQRKILPKANSFFAPQTSAQLSSQNNLDDIQKTRINYYKQFHIPTGSHFYNYHITNIYNLSKSYQNQISPEVSATINNRHRAINRRISLFGNALIVYGVVALTTFTKKWSKLTTNPFSRTYFLLMLSSFWAVSQFERTFYREFAIIEYHSEFQKIILLHQKDQHILL